MLDRNDKLSSVARVKVKYDNFTGIVSLHGNNDYTAVAVLRSNRENRRYFDRCRFITLCGDNRNGGSRGSGI